MEKASHRPVVSESTHRMHLEWSVTRRKDRLDAKDGRAGQLETDCFPGAAFPLCKTMNILAPGRGEAVKHCERT